MIDNLKKFLPILRPYRKKVFLAVLLGGIAGAATGGGITKGSEWLFQRIFDGEQNLSTYELGLFASLFPSLFMIIGISTFGSAYLINAAGLSAIRDLRVSLFERLQLLPIAYLQTKKTGDLVSRLTSDTHMLNMTLNFVAKKVIIQPATFLAAISYLIYTALENPGVFEIYISLAILPVVVVPIRYFSRKLEKKARSQQEEMAHVTNDISQNLGAAREVRAFNLQDRENNRFAKQIGTLLRAQLKVVKYTFALGPAVEIVTSVGLSIAFIIGYKNGVKAEVFLAIFFALYFTYDSVKKLGAFSGELSKGAAALDRVNEVIEEPLRLDDPENPVEFSSAKGDIEFRNVTFSYDDKAALKDVNVSLPAGTICALVGPSGAGKSTFANLVARMGDVNSGEILVDGHDVRRYRQNDLRSQIAIVSQEPVLFDDTILENIRLGRQNASDEEVYEAAKFAFADEFIAELSNGYQTIVGQRGDRLSGGQKQRIAIARAFLRNASILILDEATSALDSKSEKKIQQAIEELVTGKTVLIIAHRFSTIKMATQILVFEEGEIIDSGTHSELSERCDLYKKLYEQQHFGS